MLFLEYDSQVPEGVLVGDQVPTGAALLTADTTNTLDASAVRLRSARFGLLLSDINYCDSVVFHLNDKLLLVQVFRCFPSL